MPISQRLSDPKVKHFGYYNNINLGFSSITERENMPKPEKTLLGTGFIAGKRDSTLYKKLYCLSDGMQEELVMTIYEQLSGVGWIFRFHEKTPQAVRILAQVLNEINTETPQRFYATFTGGSAFCNSGLAQIIISLLKPFHFKSIAWNTWSWLPNNLALCGTNSYVVSLDLRAGNVKSFATSFHEVELFVNRNDFLEQNRNVTKESAVQLLKNWLSENPDLLHHKSRIMELAKKDPNVYSFNFLPRAGVENAYIMVSYEKNRQYSDIKAMIANPRTEVLIMLPGKKCEFPVGVEKNSPPSLATTQFLNEDLPSEPRIRHNVKKTVVPKRPERALAAPLQHDEYVVDESQLFHAQLTVLSSLYGQEATQTLTRISAIKNDLVAGRLPTKSVEKYYVCDLPGLSRSRGRGAWRLLITRQMNMLTLHAIADYHNGVWKQWG